MTTNTGYVRNTDPAESHNAAASIKGTVEADRLKVLGTFVELPRATYREAAEYALRKENPDIARVESLRRRGSDLKRNGWITQVAKKDGQAVFEITEEGKTVASNLQA